MGNWTDDTHMSLYLGEAILAHGPVTDQSPLEPDRFGDLVGDAFVRWLHDPLTPTTAPGITCLAGVRNFERDRDWKTERYPVVRRLRGGDADRPARPGLAGRDLLEAARISAVVTHAHPNAQEAAMAGAWLVEADPGDRGLGRRPGGGGDPGPRRTLEPGRRTSPESLRAALDWASRGEDWLDEAAIPPGDGGWRSGSALGLAVAAALRWSEDLGLAVEKAARIRGDSDSVACLTGALLGAALGTEAIPPDWLDDPAAARRDYRPRGSVGGAGCLLCLTGPR